MWPCPFHRFFIQKNILTIRIFIFIISDRFFFMNFSKRIKVIFLNQNIGWVRLIEMWMSVFLIHGSYKWKNFFFISQEISQWAYLGWTLCTYSVMYINSFKIKIFFFLIRFEMERVSRVSILKSIDTIHAFRVKWRKYCKYIQRLLKDSKTTEN